MFGGVWVWLAPGYMTLLVFSMDRLIAGHAQNADPEAEFPAATRLLVALGVAHFAVLGLTVWALGGGSGLTLAERVLTGIAAGLVFGQISHPVAHELIHNPRRDLRKLGQWVYTSLMVGHHASTHLLVHHVHVASRNDPNSAPMGEGFYRFALRAGIGGFRAGLEAENRRRARSIVPNRTHPYVLYVCGAGLVLGGAFMIAGPLGMAGFAAITLYAQMQILLSDYVQHYGLRRAVLADGRPEPVGPQHSWNAPQVFSSALMLNAPRHSDHHVTPSRQYPALQLNAAQMPMLPRSLPVMAVLALIPPLWFRVMNPRCREWGQYLTTPRHHSAREIPQAVLDHAKAAGLDSPVLANSGHARLPSSALPYDRQHRRDGRRPDERKGI